VNAAAAIDIATQVLSAEAGVRWAYVFGSVARGEPFRDVDLAVMPRAGSLTGGVAWGLLIARLEAALGAKVDLVDLSGAELPFVGPMLRERRVLVDRDPDARGTWEADTTSRWLDFEPSYLEYLRRRSEAMRQRIAAGR
jgi:predicted nucleotidyltransferase